MFSRVQKKNMEKKRSKRIHEILIISTALVLFSLMTLIFSYIVNNSQSAPYIDEIFHVPQAQLFCRNIWNEWDPKITTLPGLYLISYIFLKPLEIFNEDFCSLFLLRMINLLGTIINFLLSYLIMSKLHNLSKPRTLFPVYRNVVSAVNLAMFPTLYFFTFLYYTDVWSTTFVLLMYYGHVSKNKYSKFLTGLSGLFAVMMRQTNIIWVGFMIMNDAWKIFTKNMKFRKQDYDFTVDALKSLKTYFFVEPQYVYTKNKNRIRQKKNIFSLVKEIFVTTYPSLGVCMLFVLFLVLNGSVVVGDKTAHSAVLHPMQNFYFLDFCAFFSLPYLIHNVISRKMLPNVYVVLSLSCFSAIISEVNKIEHPYLLADNRHLAFYIWKRIFGHVTIRRIITVTYAVAGTMLFDLLDHCTFMFKACLTLSVILNLTFQHLFELRYFIIPYIIIRLNFRQNKSVWFEFLFFLIINVCTLYLFLNKPFSWDSEPDTVQRFIW